MLTKLLAGYSAQGDRYDELLAAPGAPRAHWDAFMRSLAERGEREVSDTLSLTERQIREQGITYNVYEDAMGASRPWEVDPLPLLLPAEEWEQIEAGIEQRADLLNRVLGDIYGPQELLKSGAIPPPVVFGHRGFLGPAQGLAPVSGMHLLQYAADLARSPDGRWWVVSDRTQAPSGSGYALENRLVVSRVFPQMFRELPVQHLASYFEALRSALMRWAPRGDGPTRIVLLTPGPYNETYFEHALLARYLGFALVEGNDLTVRNDRVWLKTIGGLERVHAIVRRQDDDYCDPLELRSDSALGIAGLTECARRGNVLLANALGSGVLESGALLGYLPKLARRLLGEELLLPSVATWWLGEPAAFADAFQRPERLIIKPLERSPSERPIVVEDLSEAERNSLMERIAARPQHYVAQEWVHVSQAPVLEGAGGEAFAARTVGLRVFAVATPGGWRVMPGGLTRVAGDEDSRIIAMQRGGRSKDTWVLSDAPVNASFSLLSQTVTAEQLVDSNATLASRAAENLFWFGRYGERCDASVRLLRVALGQVLDDPGARSAGVQPAWVLAAQLGLIESTAKNVPRLLRRAATNPEATLNQRLRQLSRVAFSLRDRMSTDHWRTLNRLIGDPVFTREPSLPNTLVWLDRATTAMMTLSGFVLDGMTRGIGWRFLSMGRRIERLSTMCTALTVAIEDGRDHDLDWLLEFADSSVTYRSRYLAAPEWLPVLDMLVRDVANPRSLAFQAKGLSEYIAKIEATHGRFAGESLAPAHAALRALEPADLHPESEVLVETLAQLQRAAFAVSDDISMKFFSHAVTRSVLSLVA
ncbi:MAG: circularly permuted type 2 ATP-grasp protein [Burkholderiales bacterium]|nr:circularly permuted type 2 ATP-grasp protein [Burkholderiales bacterium]